MAPWDLSFEKSCIFRHHLPMIQTSQINDRYEIEMKDEKRKKAPINFFIEPSPKFVNIDFVLLFSFSFYILRVSSSEVSERSEKIGPESSKTFNQNHACSIGILGKFMFFHGRLAMIMPALTKPCQPCHDHVSLAMTMPALPWPCQPCYDHASLAMTIPALPWPCQPCHDHASVAMTMPVLALLYIIMAISPQGLLEICHDHASLTMTMPALPWPCQFWHCCT